MKSQRKGGIVGDLINGTGGLVISVILIFVVIATITGAGLLTTGSAEANATNRMTGNLTAGIDNVSAKIPTILLVSAVVILFGVLVILVARAKAMTAGSNGSL